MCGLYNIIAIIDRTRGCFNPETAPTANGRQESSILFKRTDPKGRRGGDDGKWKTTILCGILRSKGEFPFNFVVNNN